jgi:anti-sigma factor RsiW
MGGTEDTMTGCNFQSLEALLDGKLDLESQLDVYDHLDRCRECKDTVYHMKRSRDEAALIFRARKQRTRSIA